MHRKPKIIFVGNYSRADYVRLLEASKDYCELYFLFFTTPREEQSTYYQSYGKAIYWSDFKNAQQLVGQLQPDKIVFLYIESYNHVALNLACREAAVPTYLLEHGLRADYVVGFDPAISPTPVQSFTNTLKQYWYLVRDFIPRLKSRNFLNNTIELLKADDRSFILEFIKIRSRSNYLGTFRVLHSEKRLADYYISFSLKLYEAFKAHEAPYFGGETSFIGVPYFDKLATIEPAVQERAILFIDQPLAEQGLLQWNPAYKSQFTKQLLTIAQRYNYKLYVKLHPVQTHGYWPQASQIQTIDEEELQRLSPSIPVVVGFYSTYLMPFAAFKHTTLITLENHPAGKLDVSKPFINAGVAHPVYNLEELPAALENIEKLHQKQLPNKKQFEQDWLYKFDGKAGERLRDILLSNYINTNIYGRKA